MIETVQNEVEFVRSFQITLDSSSAIKVKSWGTLLAKLVQVHELQCSNFR